MEVGLVEWFSFEEREKVGRAVRDLQELGVKHLRTSFSWADWQRPGGEAWFDYFVPALGEVGIELFPSLFYTPVTEAIRDAEGKVKVSYPPRNLEAYAEFVNTMLVRYGKYFKWVQLWNEPNWKVYWDDSLDPGFTKYARMIGLAAQVVHGHGKKNALGGLMPYEAQFLTRMHECDVLQYIDAICLHHAESWPPRERWYGWDTTIANARAVIKGHSCNAEIWVAEAGLSTFAEEPITLEKQYQQQIEFFKTLPKISAERIYIIFLYDQRPEHLTDDAINLGVEPDPIAYHYGIKKVNGEAKPLFEYWKRQGSG